jgi:hypothetical protein
MRNNIRFADTTFGTYAFPWRVSTSGHRLADAKMLEVATNIGEPLEVDLRPPWLVPVGVEQRQYPGLADRMLHRRFASLKDDEILDFANRYGFLGRPVALVTRGKSEVIFGESVRRWQDEIDEIGCLLAIWDLVAKGEGSELAQAVFWNGTDSVEIRGTCVRGVGEYELLRQRQRRGPGDFFQLLASSRDEKTASVLEIWNKLVGPQRYIEPARYYVCFEVNERLQGRVAPQVSPLLDSQVHLWPKTLLDAMWLMFMWEISGETKTLCCPACKNWTELDDRRMKYCSKACKQRAYRARRAPKRKKGERSHERTVK